MSHRFVLTDLRMSYSFFILFGWDILYPYDILRSSSPCFGIIFDPIRIRFRRSFLIYMYEYKYVYIQSYPHHCRLRRIRACLSWQARILNRFDPFVALPACFLFACIDERNSKLKIETGCAGIVLRVKQIVGALVLPTI